MTVNAALEGGAGNLRDGNLVGLSHDIIGHLTGPLTSELSKWLKLVDMEAAVTFTRRATPWMPVPDVRRRGGFAMDGFTLRYLHPPGGDDNNGGGSAGGGGGGSGGGGGRREGGGGGVGGGGGCSG